MISSTRFRLMPRFTRSPFALGMRCSPVPKGSSRYFSMLAPSPMSPCAQVVIVVRSPLRAPFPCRRRVYAHERYCFG
jgi:hypothetical protein